MEYTYELLRRCNGLRFSCTIWRKRIEGIIKVADSFITLCYGDIQLGNLATAERTDYLYFDENLGDLPEDFEIVVRNPDTYDDWQVGDKVSSKSGVFTVLFRCGEVVALGTLDNRTLNGVYTRLELIQQGFSLILTDIEEEILKEKKVPEEEYIFKKYGAVLVRNTAAHCWQADVFLKYILELNHRTCTYKCINGTWNYCIPLNKETESLLGTDRPYKEEE